MYKNYFSIFFVLLVFGYSPMMAQNKKICTTEDQHLLLERITQNRIYHENNPGLLNKREPVYIPIKFNLLAEFDGKGRIGYQAVLDQMCQLNIDYNPFEIYFYMDDNGSEDATPYFNHIDHTGVFNDPRTNTAQNLFEEEKDDGAVNVFVINDAGTSGATTSAGFYSPFGDYIVMEKGQVALDNVTITHEIGHFFSLSHPHIGWEDTGWGNADPNIYSPIYAYGTTVTATIVQSAQSAPTQVELVNGNNCTTAGDRICDTPPDYGFGPHQSQCNFNQKVYDRNGEEVKPMEENIMGYFNNCNYEFTADQTEAVMADYLSPGRSFLRTGYVPAITEAVTDLPVIISPTPSSTSDFFNSVVFEWEPVNNATEYLLVISDIAGNRNSYFTKNTAILIEDLEPNSTYLWNVQPFNELGSCIKSNTAFLMTNDLNTGTNEIDAIQNIVVYPNPVDKTDELQISITTKNSIDTEMSIYHVNGQKLDQRVIGLQSGNNKVGIDVNDYDAGYYLIKLKTEDGITTQSFIVK